MITELEIFNMALGQVGVSNLSNLTDLSDKRMQAYRTYYNQAVQSVLHRIQMSFNTKVDQLSLLSEQTVTGWDYVYQFPGDCLQVFDVVDSDGVPAERWGVYRIGAISDTVIVTDTETASAQFCQVVTETSVFPPILIDALRYRLAADIAVFLTGDGQKMATNHQIYEDIVTKAKANDFTQRASTLPEASTYTDARA